MIIENVEEYLDLTKAVKRKKNSIIIFYQLWRFFLIFQLFAYHFLELFFLKLLKKSPSKSRFVIARVVSNIFYREISLVVHSFENRKN